VWIIARPKRRITIKDLEFLKSNLESTKHIGIMSSNVGMTKTVENEIKNNRFIKYINLPKKIEINKYTLPGEFHQVGF